MITAEVIPISTKDAKTVKALQHVGFRILSIGESIIITGKQKLFEQFFKMKLVKLSKDIISSSPTPKRNEFYRPETPPIIPSEFKSLIKEVVFPEPPEYFNYIIPSIL